MRVCACACACVCMGVVVHVSARLHIPWIRGPAFGSGPACLFIYYLYFSVDMVYGVKALLLLMHIFCMTWTHRQLCPPAGINQALCRRAETQTARVILTLDTFSPSLQATAVILIPNHHLHHNPRGEGNTQEVDMVLFGQRCSSGSAICWGEAARLWLIT